MGYPRALPVIEQLVRIPAFDRPIALEQNDAPPASREGERGREAG